MSVQCGPGSRFDVDAVWADTLAEALADPAPLWERAFSEKGAFLSQMSVLAALLQQCDARATSCVVKAMTSIDATELTLGHRICLSGRG